jgi:pyruvate kinase
MCTIKDGGITMEITKIKPIRLRFRFTVDNVYQVVAIMGYDGINVSQGDLDSLHLDDEKRAELVKLLKNEIQKIYKSFNHAKE